MWYTEIPLPHPTGYKWVGRRREEKGAPERRLARAVLESLEPDALEDPKALGDLLDALGVEAIAIPFPGREEGVYDLYRRIRR